MPTLSPVDAVVVVAGVEVVVAALFEFSVDVLLLLVSVVPQPIKTAAHRTQTTRRVLLSIRVTPSEVQIGKHLNRLGSEIEKAALSYTRAGKLL